MEIISGAVSPQIQIMPQLDDEQPCKCLAAWVCMCLKGGYCVGVI
jgi:hypothetical protein